MLGQITLVLADIDIVEFDLVAGLDLDLLGNFSACIYPVALIGAEDGFEAAFLNLEATLQSLDHLPVSRRVRKMHVKRLRIDGTGFAKAHLPAPQLHTAFVVRIEDPHMSILLASFLRAFSPALFSSPPAPRTPLPPADHPAHRMPRWSASWPSVPPSARKSGLPS